jgi:hypothetical protein
MRERGRYQIQFMKTRSSSAVGQKIDLDFNLDSLRITDPGEEEDGSQTSFSQGGGRGATGTSSILSGLKKTSTVIDSSTGEIAREPDDGLAAPKIRGKADSSRIRDMLANINSERD